MSELVCNIFKDTFSKDCKYIYDIETILMYIKEGRWKGKIEEIRATKDKKERDALKKFLPGVTFSGTFKDSRKEKNMTYYNRLVIIDIDNIKGADKNRVNKGLVMDPWCVAKFESPSGGIKALFRTNCNDVQYHKDYCFIQLEEYFLEIYDIQIDKSGKDWTRLCYVSYDPNLHYNPNYIEFPIDKTKKSRELRNVGASMANYKEVSYDSKYIFDICVKMIKGSKVGTYHKGNRNHFIFCLSCLLCEHGIQQGDTLALLQYNYTLGLKEIETTVKSAYGRATFAVKQIMVDRSEQQKLF